jgi:hypothetical protein
MDQHKIILDTTLANKGTLVTVHELGHSRAKRSAMSLVTSLPKL